MNKVISQEKEKRDKYQKKRSFGSGTDKKTQFLTNEEQIHCMVDDYLSKQICPPRPKRRIKRANCGRRINVVVDTVATKPSSILQNTSFDTRDDARTPSKKASTKAKLATKSVEDELKEFNTFTIDDDAPDQQFDLDECWNLMMRLSLKMTKHLNLQYEKYAKRQKRF